MPGPTLIRPERIETLRCADPRPGWRGCEPAVIALGQWADGRWSYGVSAHCAGIGRGRGVSEWRTGPPMARFASRVDALDAAVIELIEVVRSWADLATAAELTRIRDWAVSQRTAQGDLFGMAA